MKDNVLSHWSEEELIGINCLLKGDGSVIILNCYDVEQGNEKLYFSFPLCETTVSSLENLMMIYGHM